MKQELLGMATLLGSWTSIEGPGEYVARFLAVSKPFSTRFSNDSGTEFFWSSGLKRSWMTEFL